jgi:hypothetical protein
MRSTNPRQETPMTAATNPQTFYDKPLFKIISVNFPEFRTPQGVFGVEAFGKAIGMSHEGVYKWFRANKLSIDGVKRIVEASKSPASGQYRLKKEDLYPFCFPA